MFLVSCGVWKPSISFPFPSEIWILIRFRLILYLCNTCWKSGGPSPSIWSSPPLTSEAENQERYVVCFFLGFLCSVVHPCRLDIILFSSQEWLTHIRSEVPRWIKAFKIKFLGGWFGEDNLFLQNYYQILLFCFSIQCCGYLVNRDRLTDICHPGGLCHRWSSTQVAVSFVTIHATLSNLVKKSDLHFIFCVNLLFWKSLTILLNLSFLSVLQILCPKNLRLIFAAQFDFYMTISADTLN